MKPLLGFLKTTVLGGLLVLLPLIGIAVQGSSTVTYGALSDFVHRQRQSRGHQHTLLTIGIEWHSATFVAWEVQLVL